MTEEAFRVVVRVRPMNKIEKEKNTEEVVQTVEDNVVVVSAPALSKDDVLRQHRSREKKFAFDRVFGPQSSQQDVFTHTTEDVIKDVLQGYNATIFAYGPTGSGKTFTMLGTSEQPGVMVLTLKLLFELVEADNKLSTKITISYVEIYNEAIKDLLGPPGLSENLDLREDPLKGVSVAGIREFTVTSTDEVMNLLQRGNKNRTTEATKANETSSRSHAVCQVLIERKEKTANINAEIKVGKLSLIDLAGSERAVHTENTGKLLREGANINKSLLALANCINVLGDKKKKGAFVNYRDSKLTRLLKDSLGGSCKTVMIAAIPPSAASFEEILNTLKYANRAKNIKVKPNQTIKNVTYHIKEYQKIISDLRNEIFELKQQMTRAQKENVSSFSEVVRYDSVKEQKQFLEIQKHIIDNFSDKMQLRKSLIDLEDTNSIDRVEIDRKYEEIAKWEEDNPNKDKITNEFCQNLLSEIKIIQENMNENALKKEELHKRIQELDEHSYILREEFPRKVTKHERRQLLQYLIQSQNLELEKLELQFYIAIKDKIIQDQAKVLKENGLANLISYDYYGILPQDLPLSGKEEITSSESKLKSPHSDNHFDNNNSPLRLAPLAIVPSGSQESTSSFSEHSTTSVSKPGSAYSESSQVENSRRLPKLEKKRRRRKRKNNHSQNGIILPNQVSYPPVRNPSFGNLNQFQVKPSLIPRLKNITKQNSELP